VDIAEARERGDGTQEQDRAGGRERGESSHSSTVNELGALTQVLRAATAGVDPQLLGLAAPAPPTIREVTATGTRLQSPLPNRGPFSPVAYVIAEPCIGTKDNSCVEVCPVDCIHPTPDEPDYDAVEMLYIDPDECIDCDACVEACPVDACFAEDQLPDEWQKFTELNAEYYKSKS
jgi:ferredoxin